jgi:transposase
VSISVKTRPSTGPQVFAGLNLSTERQLVFGFRAILRGGKVTTLHRWMEQTRKTGIHSLVRFVRTLKQDLSALEAAVSEPWSNGPVEGQLNRLKMLKRQMYGRAGCRTVLKS